MKDGLEGGWELSGVVAGCDRVAEKCRPFQTSGASAAELWVATSSSMTA